MPQFAKYMIVVAIADLLILMGIQGNLGKVLAVIFVPGDVTVLDENGNPTSPIGAF
jgi:hypothetical protein